MVLTPDFDVTRIAITNPAIADATVVQPREILIDGKAPGTISLIVWGGAGQRVQYDVVVEQPVAGLEQQLRQLFPGEEIQVDAERRCGRPLRPCIEHPGHAARGGNRTGIGAQGERHQHAAGARRDRCAAGHAAGPVCRGKPPGAH